MCKSRLPGGGETCETKYQMSNIWTHRQHKLGKVFFWALFKPTAWGIGFAMEKPWLVAGTLCQSPSSICSDGCKTHCKRSVFQLNQIILYIFCIYLSCFVSRSLPNLILDFHHHSRVRPKLLECRQCCLSGTLPRLSKRPGLQKLLRFDWRIYGWGHTICKIGKHQKGANCGAERRLSAVGVCWKVNQMKNLCTWLGCKHGRTVNLTALRKTV